MTDCDVCGNGERDTIGPYTEQCDDGDVDNNDGCNSNC